MILPATSSGWRRDPMAFADTVGAIGTVVNLREGQGTTTVEQDDFFAGSSVGTRLIAEATHRLHRGTRGDPGLGDPDDQ